jgi:hypothetical protein
VGLTRNPQGKIPSGRTERFVVPWTPDCSEALMFSPIGGLGRATSCGQDSGDDISESVTCGQSVAR